jgi:nitrogen fixation protein NifQ
MLQDLPQEVLHARAGGTLNPAPVPLALRRRAARGDEVDDVLGLLLQHANPAAGDATEIARAIAVACLGDQHLWQDLQLGSRAELSALLQHWFPTLVQRNSGDMKWKKFLYKQLCEREALFVCRSPSCASCTEHALCFGPETA